MTAEVAEGLASAYAAWRRSPLGRITDELERDLLLERIGPLCGRRILDVGCGDGRLVRELAGRGAAAIGVDASLRMLQAASDGGGAVALARAEALPFPAASFDVVVAITVLCFVEDARTMLADMVRVLRPGGRLVLGELNRWSTWAARRRIRGRLGSPVWRAPHFRSPSELRRLAPAAGLVDVAVGVPFSTRPSAWPRACSARSIDGSAPGPPPAPPFWGSPPKSPDDRPTPKDTDVTTPDNDIPPLLTDKHYASPSLFTPESLLREARRQKGAPPQPVPAVCLLDPDGDIVRRLRAEGRSRRHLGWVCYHTELDVFTLDGREVGVLGCAVGAAFAVLVAEELFASGCDLLLSVTSAGQLVDLRPPPYFVAIDRALRDEGTSYHYRPPAATAAAPAHLLARVDGAFDDLPEPVLRGGSWTTDAPFRETEAAIAAARERGLVAVEMEAAALYAFAEARGRAVLCFAHVTNQMGQIDGDFEKGAADGVEDALALVARAAARLAPAG